MTNQTVYNFSAGPAVLPKSVLLQAQEEMLDYQGSGMSVMEMSHRGSIFMDILTTAEQNLRDLMGIPSNYKVLFLQGGAYTQFSMVPLNLAGGFETMDAVVSGTWSLNASKQMGYLSEAKVHIAANSIQNNQFSYAPLPENWQISPNSAFTHFASNETANGLQYQQLPSFPKETTLVCDMSSDILSRPINVNDFGLIYAGAQKNIGAAGATIVIIREDLLDRTRNDVPDIWRYQSFIKKQGMYNTPCTYAIYIAGLVFKWLKAQGGVHTIEQLNQQKATLLYEMINQSEGFYRNPIQTDFRSKMNVVFYTPNEQLDALFVQEAEKQGLKGLKGYASMGGMRASIYNGMSLNGVQILADFMKNFQQKHQ
ncbi:3-phosphoserine/phosphohydroxythreonine transaminase [Neisseria sp. Ec49-e6-T10]|uniref:3-phosphoserine/phosphohydroxythreonine transaminase n=1 Tax=Neisseria sp. Ec49-e6-T10 TaxID=3140744 RepID=UPI003EB7BC23